MKIALVHDWLTGMRGGERVLEAICEIFPKADIFTLLHVPGSVSKTIEERIVKTSFVQKLPVARRFYRHYLPLFPMAVEGFDLRGYDLVLSTSHCVAKGVLVPESALNISYVFTPMRYIWDKFNDYFGGGFIKKRAFALVAHYLRAWDVTSASRVDRFIASSKYVAERIRRCYGRESTVIHPPVDCSLFTPDAGPPEDFFLLVSAFVPYKRLDVAVEAFTRTGDRLVVVGTGQEEKRLRAMAGPNIEFSGRVPDAELKKLYARSRAFVFPSDEDFGIVPLEAMASGRPVIAYGGGGALETIVPLFRDKGRNIKNKRPTGVFFYEQSAPSLVEALGTFKEHEEEFSPDVLRARALEFDRPLFKRRIKDAVITMYNEHISGEGRCSKNTASFLKTSFS